LYYSCLFYTLSMDSHAVVDDSFYKGLFLVGMNKLHDSFPIDFVDSRFLYSWRYQRLRKMKPDSFPYPDTEY
jgi:hypothetical protein